MHGDRPLLDVPPPTWRRIKAIVAITSARPRNRQELGESGVDDPKTVPAQSLPELIDSSDSSDRSGSTSSST